MPIQSVTIFGSAYVPEGTEHYTHGLRLGALLAERGWTVITGGYGGLMEAVSRGAHGAGGHTIGVTCSIFTARLGPNPWVKEEIPTPTLFERIRTMIELSQAQIAMPGGLGTLAEIAMTWNLRQQHVVTGGGLILVGSAWTELMDHFGKSAVVRPQDMDYFRCVDDAEAAVKVLSNGASGNHPAVQTTA